MNVITLRNRLAQAEEKSPQKIASRKELNERLLALGLNPDDEWDWIVHNKVTHISITQRTADHLNVPLETVLAACYE